MIATRLCEDNIDIMLAVSSIGQTKLLEKIKRFGPDSVYGRSLRRKYYFIPSGYLSYALNESVCMTEDSFTEKFNADMTKIDIKFVEITRK